MSQDSCLIRGPEGRKQPSNPGASQELIQTIIEGLEEFARTSLGNRPTAPELYQAAAGLEAKLRNSEGPPIYSGWKLPCDVKLPNGDIIARGVRCGRYGARSTRLTDGRRWPACLTAATHEHD